MIGSLRISTESHGRNCMRVKEEKARKVKKEKPQFHSTTLALNGSNEELSHD